MIERRKFIGLLAGAAAASPVALRAQKSPLPMIGFLHSVSLQPMAQYVRGFHDGLREAGYVDGRDVTIEYWGAEGDYRRLPALAADMVRRQVTVIAATGGLATALAAKSATATIPVVFSIGADPVASGLVASLNRPGGNITGVTTLSVELIAKRIELFRALLPHATTLALLVNGNHPASEIEARQAEAAASRMQGLTLRILRASTDQEIDAAFAALPGIQAAGLLIQNEPFFTARSAELAERALRCAIPTTFGIREAAEAGGLMSYGDSLRDAYRLTGIYVGRILKGEKPANLPVRQSTGVELIINKKTANALGLSIPPILDMLADRIIE